MGKGDISCSCYFSSSKNSYIYLSVFGMEFVKYQSETLFLVVWVLFYVIMGSFIIYFLGIDGTYFLQIMR